MLSPWSPAPSFGIVLLTIASQGFARQAPDFQREVRPILSRSCFACHGPDGEHRQADLRLDRADVATGAREGGAAIVPGNPAASLLVQRIRAGDGERMPPPDAGPALEPEQVEILERWIAAGAPYAEHWSFVPPERPEPPPVSAPEWVRNPVDAFVLARLDAAGLAPAAEADRHVIARRLALDLVGLPPTPGEVRAFVADDRPDAYERYVDGLLADPGYGERWAWMWLDLARYADSAGYGSDPLRTIWRWRDWVIDAFDSNQPYDEFTRDQMAGDLLQGATLEQRLATAFHRNSMTNTEGGTDDEEFRIEAVKDRTNTTMAVWMGLTARCAQCHNHKFDPLSQTEYYGLSAFLDQTADSDRGDEQPRIATPSRDQAARLVELEDELARTRDRLANPTHDIAAGLAAWMRAAREREASWRSLAPSSARGSGAGAYAWDGDGVVRAEGPPSDREELLLDLELPPGRWTGLALDALASNDLPGNGPGLSPGNGNFVLTEIAVELPPPAHAQAGGARYLRLALPGTGRILSLAEVEVVSDGQNVAPAGTATQSSTAYQGPAELAIDGDTTGVHAEGSVTHTATEADPWWELDLGAVRAIESIAIWNRTDGDLYRRLDGLVLSLLDDARATVWRGRLGHAPRTSREIRPAEHGTDWAIATASASHEQAGFGAAAAIDGDEEAQIGWAIAPRQGETHRAVFAFEEALELAEPTTLRVRLVQAYGTSHVLGRLRVLATGHEGPLRALPDAVSRALAAAPHCSDEDQANLAAHYATVDPEREALRAEEARLAQAIESLNVVETPVLEELPPDRRRTTHVLRKGNFLDRGPAVTAGVPEAFHPFPEGAPLDRRGLARWLTAPGNPLTARVAANRYWSRLFGVGIVATEEDFGSQGEAPSHPALLDWLAVEYVDNGWDTKALLRTIVTSATYRQSARVDGAKLELDPENRLLSRGPRFRLEAEMVRDQALAVSGLLSAKRHGPSVFPPQPEGLWRAAFNGQRNWKTSTGEDRYRRALYVFWRRTIPYPSMEVFDAPSRETCTPRRIRTNTPLQAFVTLNDPVYVEAAQALGRRMVAEGGLTPGSRARFGWWLCLQRPPDPASVEDLVALYRDALAHLADVSDEEALALATDPLGELPAGADPRESAAWTVVANVLLNLDAVLTKE